MSKNNLEKKPDFFETALVNIPLPLSISDYDGKRLYINKSFELFYKKVGKQALGLKIDELYLPEDKNRIVEALDKCRSKGYSSCEATTIQGNGNPTPVVLNFTLFESDNNKYIITTATDISDLKRREEELNFIFENSRAAMVLTDEKGRWIKINRAFCRDTGYPKEELLGKKLTKQPFTTEETIKALDKFRNYTIEKRMEAKEFIDVPAKKKNGDLLIHSAFQVPFATGKGVLYTAIDVTKDRLNEKEYKKFVEDITFVAESLAKGDYTYRVNTDYKNEDIKLTAETLNTVISYLEKSDEELQSLIKELATPSLEVMDRVVVMPLVGKLTSDRALDAMEHILEKIEEIKAYAAIIDITGVPTIDSAVADNLIKTIEAIRLVGATPVLSGVSANAAKNLVRIGIKFDFVTKGSLSEAINYVNKINIDN